jgi:hypothetical protein
VHYVVEYAWFDDTRSIVRFTVIAVREATAREAPITEGFYGFDPFHGRLYTFAAFTWDATGWGTVGESDHQTSRRVTFARSRGPDGVTTWVRDAFENIDRDSWRNVTSIRQGDEASWMRARRRAQRERAATSRGVSDVRDGGPSGDSSPSSSARPRATTRTEASRLKPPGGLRGEHVGDGVRVEQAPAPDAIHRVGLGYAPGIAGGADAAPLAGEGDEALGGAGVATHAGEAMGQDAAAQVGAEVVLDPAGHALAAGVGFGGVSQEGLEVVLDEGVERRVGGLAPAVDGGAGASRALRVRWERGARGRPVSA